MEKWAGEVAVVTGASAGIGKAVTLALAHHGLRVAALARRQDRLEELSRNFKGKGSIKGYRCDVTKEKDIESVFAQVEKDLGRIRVLVNNAGIATLTDLMDFNITAWRQMFDTNVFGMFSCVKQVVNSVLSTNDKKLNHIFNINSIAGHQEPTRPQATVYCATKHCVTIITKSLLRQFGSKNLKNIRLTSISPGVVETEIFSVGGWESFDMSKIPHLSPDNIAAGIIAALALPDNVVASELTLKPAGEEL